MAKQNSSVKYAVAGIAVALVFAVVVPAMAQFRGDYGRSYGRNGGFGDSNFERSGFEGGRGFEMGGSDMDLRKKMELDRRMEMEGGGRGFEGGQGFGGGVGGGVNSGFAPMGGDFGGRMSSGPNPFDGLCRGINSRNFSGMLEQYESLCSEMDLECQTVSDPFEDIDDQLGEIKEEMVSKMQEIKEAEFDEDLDLISEIKADLKDLRKQEKSLKKQRTSIAKGAVKTLKSACNSAKTVMKAKLKQDREEIDRDNEEQTREAQQRQQNWDSKWNQPQPVQQYAPAQQYVPQVQIAPQQTTPSVTAPTTQVPAVTAPLDSTITVPTAVPQQ